MKKFIFVFFALIISSTFFTGCMVDRDSNGCVGDACFTVSTYTLGYGAYSTASLLSTFSGMSSYSSLFGLDEGYINLSNGRNKSVAEEDIESFNRYYNMLAPYMAMESDNLFSFTGAKVEDSSYQYNLDLNLAMGDGIVKRMTMRYNVGEEIDSGDLVDDEYEDEEIGSQFEGILVMGQNTYDFVGYSEIEDGEEKFELKAVMNETNYVRIILKKEGNENKFAYEIMENGVSEITEVKIEDGAFEFKIELKFRNGNEENTYTLKNEYENGEEVTKIEFSGNGQHGFMYVNKVVDPVTGEETIEYTIKPDNEEEVVVEKDVDNDKSGEEEDD